MMYSSNINEVIIKGTYSLPYATPRERILTMCRGIAKGRPYLSTVEVIGANRIRFKSVSIEVFGSEVSMTLAGVRRGEGLEFFANNLPDLVN